MLLTTMGRRILAYLLSVLLVTQSAAVPPVSAPDRRRAPEESTLCALSLSAFPASKNPVHPQAPPFPISSGLLASGHWNPRIEPDESIAPAMWHLGERDISMRFEPFASPYVFGGSGVSGGKGSGKVQGGPVYVPKYVTPARVERFLNLFINVRKRPDYILPSANADLNDILLQYLSGTFSAAHAAEELYFKHEWPLVVSLMNLALIEQMVRCDGYAPSIESIAGLLVALDRRRRNLPVSEAVYQRGLNRQIKVVLRPKDFRIKLVDGALERFRVMFESLTSEQKSNVNSPPLWEYILRAGIEAHWSVRDLRSVWERYADPADDQATFERLRREGWKGVIYESIQLSVNTLSRGCFWRFSDLMFRIQESWEKAESAIEEQLVLDYALAFILTRHLYLEGMHIADSRAELMDPPAFIEVLRHWIPRLAAIRPWFEPSIPDTFYAAQLRGLAAFCDLRLFDPSIGTLTPQEQERIGPQGSKGAMREAFLKIFSGLDAVDETGKHTGEKLPLETLHGVVEDILRSQREYPEDFPEEEFYRYRPELFFHGIGGFSHLSLSAYDQYTKIHGSRAEVFQTHHRDYWKEVLASYAPKKQEPTMTSGGMHPQASIGRAGAESDDSIAPAFLPGRRGGMFGEASIGVAGMDQEISPVIARLGRRTPVGVGEPFTTVIQPPPGRSGAGSAPGGRATSLPVVGKRTVPRDATILLTPLELNLLNTLSKEDLYKLGLPAPNPHQIIQARGNNNFRNGNDFVRRLWEVIPVDKQRYSAGQFKARLLVIKRALSQALQPRESVGPDKEKEKMDRGLKVLKSLGRPGVNKYFRSEIARRNKMGDTQTSNLLPWLVKKGWVLEITEPRAHAKKYTITNEGYLAVQQTVASPAPRRTGWRPDGNIASAGFTLDPSPVLRLKERWEDMREPFTVPLQSMHPPSGGQGAGSSPSVRPRPGMPQLNPKSPKEIVAEWLGNQPLTHDDGNPLELAEKAFLQQDWNRAALLAAGALVQFPQNGAFAPWIAAMAMAGQGRLTIPLIQKLMENQETFVSYLEKAFRIFKKHFQFDAAESYASLLLGVNGIRGIPYGAWVDFYLADTLWSSGDPRRYESRIRQLVEGVPLTQGVANATIALLLRKGIYSGAVRVAELALGRWGRDPHLHVQYFEARLQRGEPDDWVWLDQKTRSELYKHPGSPQGLWRRSRVLFFLKQFNEALALLDRRQEKLATLELLQARLIQFEALLQVGRHEEAARMMEGLIKDNPEEAALRFRWAEVVEEIFDDSPEAGRIRQNAESAKTGRPSVWLVILQLRRAAEPLGSPRIAAFLAQARRLHPEDYALQHYKFKPSALPTDRRRIAPHGRASLVSA